MQDIIRSYDGTALYRRVDTPGGHEKGAVVITHGLGEHCRRYDWVAERLNEAGFSVWRFDNRGHGRSGGARGWLDSFRSYFYDADVLVEQALAAASRPVFMLGHSMGGFITGGYGVQFPGKLRGQVFSGACVKSVPVFDALRGADIDKIALDDSPNSLSSLICRTKAVVDAYDSDPFVLKVFTQKLLHEVFIKGVDWLMPAEKRHAYPCLILHGGDDRIVPPACSEYLYENTASTDKTLKVYPNLFHEILNEEDGKEEVIADIIAWMNARLG
ncbi:MAG: lysophospholipase [Synergistaceae bacterium]|jgi:alpha-beta hydrolase superfamily lysophospholipase|nr:lysophospholipase [Synergistaceae bacterium]